MPVDLHSIPQRPGCYFFKDSQGKIIYIGKAKDLKKRVSSYFQNRLSAAESGTLNGFGKTAELIRHIDSVEFIVVDTETEALLLEARLIRQHRPQYNIDLKDSERYAYILVTDEPFPRVMTARRQDFRRAGRKTDKNRLSPPQADIKRFFGPFVDGAYRRSLIRTVTMLAKLRTCQTLPKRACIQYHIGHCTAPCIGKSSKEDYAEQVDFAVRLLEGKTETVIARLMEEMAQASKDLKFERAKELRDHLEILSRKADRQKIESKVQMDQDIIVPVRDKDTLLIQIFHVKRGVLLGKKEFRLDPDSDMTEFIMQFYTGHEIPDEIVMESLPEESALIEETLPKVKEGKVKFIIPSKGRNKELLDLVRKNALIQLGAGDIGCKDLQDALDLKAYPRSIECFDISHLSGKQTVASMVKLVEGKPKKSDYRKFKIKTVEGIDDFKSMSEVVERRYKRILEEERPFPDLIVIDGGAGQLSAAMESLAHLNISIPIIGLAKKLEEIYIPGRDATVRLDSKREALKLLQRARDEAHRFAVAYHRVLRAKRV